MPKTKELSNIDMLFDYQKLETILSKNSVRINFDDKDLEYKLIIQYGLISDYYYFFIIGNQSPLPIRYLKISENLMPIDPIRKDDYIHQLIIGLLINKTSILME